MSFRTRTSTEAKVPGAREWDLRLYENGRLRRTMQVMRRRVPDTIQNGLVDARSWRVVFVSHCLFNENVRFLGGATRLGAVTEVLSPYIEDGVGLVQMPCPEQRVWGGVLKRWMVALYGRRILRWRPARRVVVAVVRFVTEFEYGRLARHTAAQIVDYVRSGLAVVEVVGVGASPSCGVHTTVDLDGAIAAMARCDRARVDAATVIRDVVAANVVDGEGMFVAKLRARLARRGVAVPFREHDLLAEVGVLPPPCTGSNRSAASTPVTLAPVPQGIPHGPLRAGGDVDARPSSR